MKERLQKIVARAGIASRRKAEDLIREGQVTVNGRTVTELGSLADPERDHIKVSGKRIRYESFQYYAVHKPRSVLSAVSDPLGRPVVTRLVRSDRRLHPAGRLDFDSEGLIILTNDGELTRVVTQAGRLEKRYRVKVRGQPDEKTLHRLRRGIRVTGRAYASCGLKIIKSGNNCWLEVVLKEGRNRQVRRMFEAVGHPVMRLRRISIGPVHLGNLPPGSYRKLTRAEIDGLKRG